MLARILDSFRTGAAARCSVLALSLALAVTGFPLAGPCFPLAETKTGPISHVVRNGQRLFVLIASSPLLSAGVPGDDAWSTRFVIHRGTALEPLVSRTGETGTVAGFEHVATTSEDPFPIAASLAQGTIVWDEAATVDLAGTGDSVSATYRLGADTVSFRTALAPKLPAVVEAAINGRHGQVRLGDSVVKGTIGAEMAVTIPANLGRALVDAEGFVGFVAEFGALAALVLGQSPEAAVTGNCTSKCLGCAGALVVNFATLVAVVATCGGALVTGGATAIGCFASIVGHQGASVVALAACGACSTCS